MSRESFLPHLGSEFDIESDPGTVTIGRLIDVSPATRLTAPHASFTSFSLTFAVPRAFPAESRVHVVRHPELGTMDLFLSPVGRPAREVHLEAVFNHAV
jgi:hypothetical protein